MKYVTFDDIQIVPQYSEILTRSNCDIKTRFTKNFTIDIPIVSSPMDTVTELDMALELSKLGGVGAIHRFMTIEQQCKIVSQLKHNQDNDNHTPICASIGVTGDYIERAHELVNSGCNVILIDVAHGDHILVKQTLTRLKNEKFSKEFDVIAGNVATEDGTRHLCDWGADAIRVGVGGGSLCTTRIRTGVGIPQFTSILNCVAVADGYNIPVIADGGCRTIADVVKSIGAGAESVMLGSLLSGTKETPGKIKKIGLWPNEQLYKEYRGSASLDAKISRHESGKNVEGESNIVLYKGKIKRILSDISDGLRSAMSYVGVDNIFDFRSKSQFVHVTPAGIMEAKPHGLLKR